MNKDANQLIEKLERKYKEMGLIIQQLREANIMIDDVKQDLETEYAEQVKEEKSANQLRAEIIEEAKWFVEKYLTHSEHGYGVVADNLTPLTTRTGPIKYKFVVNVEKRTIVAIGSLLHVGSIDDNYKGIAKCMPSDVFNEHIGKAIALGRALGLDVSEFENAVQPTYEIGQFIQYTRLPHRNLVEVQLIDVKDKELWFLDDEDCREVFVRSDRHNRYPDIDEPKIIDDTNAQYEITR